MLIRADLQKKEDLALLVFALASPILTEISFVARQHQGQLAGVNESMQARNDDDCK